MHLARDNKTRWNSWYTMLHVAINLRDAVEQYYEAYPDVKYADDVLTSDEWDLLGEIKSFLEKLKMATKAVESSNKCLDVILPIMDYVLKHFEAGKAKFKDHLILAPMFNSGWSKFNEYFTALYDSPAYAIALVLNPKRKFKWIEKHWNKEWLQPALESIKKVWKDEYAPAEAITQPPPRTTNDFWLDLDAEDMAEIELQDELDQYLALPRVNTDDAIAWWLEPTQQKNFPNLSKMAMDYLSIPGMSAEPERLFSSTKMTITDRRNRLGGDIIEALECLRSWLNIMDSEAELVMGLKEDITKETEAAKRQERWGTSLEE